jgi:hypothetical protein
MHTDSRHNFGLALFSPLRDFCVDLVAQLRLDFPGISCKKGEKALRSTVDYVNFMQRYCMNDFFSLLYLAIWAPNKFCLVQSFESSQTMV